MGAWHAASNGPYSVDVPAHDHPSWCWKLGFINVTISKNIRSLSYVLLQVAATQFVKLKTVTMASEARQSLPLFLS